MGVTRRKVVSYGQYINLGDFRIEFIRTNHSIADSAALAIYTPAGVIVHTGDFKVDYTPVYGDSIDLARFGELGKKGVLALMADSTNVLKPGFTMSERTVGKTFDTIFDEIVINDNNILSAETIKRLTILGARTDRYLNKVCNLQELVSQMQDTYQSQLSIQQNNLMKIFTVVTAIFLPLTLLVGWYGMNFAYMPELHWKYGYPIIIAVSTGIVVALICYFKHKKWL